MEGFFDRLDALYQGGDLGAVERFLQENLEQCPEEQQVPVLNELASFYRGVSRYEESEAAFRRALLLLEAAGQQDTPAYATVLLNLAGTCRLTRRFDQAQALFRRALELLDPEDYAYASALNNLALVRQEQGDLPGAQALAEQALEWVRRHGAPAHEVATSLNNLAAIHLRQNDLDGAAALLEEALALYDAMEQPNVHHAAALSANGVLCFRRGDLDGAEAAFQRALKLTEHFFGRNAEYAATLRNLEAVRRARTAP